MSPPPIVVASDAAAGGTRGVVAAIACIALFGVSQSMLSPLIAVRLEAEGWSSAAIGMNGAAVAAATLLATPMMPRLVGALGLPGFLTLGALLSAAMLPLFPLFPDYAPWLVLRFLQGVAAAALFLGSETWIVAGAPHEIRGRMVGLYATMLSLGFASGPPILAAVGFAGWTPFLVCAALSLAALAPVAAARRSAPAPERGDRATVPPFRFIVRAPTVFGAVILYGAIEMGVLGLLPVWGLRLGLEQEAATFLLSVLILGNVAFQIPLGALADRLNRRAMLIFCAGVSVLAAAALPWIAEVRWALWALLFVWGGIAAGLYTIALIELGARYSGATLVAGNAAVVISYGVGALIGPLLIGAAMDAVDPHGLSLALGGMAAAYLALAVVRGRRPSA